MPGYGAGDLSPDGNLAAYLDRVLMGGHLWQGTWDPEGLLSTLPAIVTALLGIFTGEWLLSEREPGEITRGMLVAGLVLVIVGLAWGLIFPINKNLWTSSYVVFSAGTALLLFGSMYWLIDVRGRRGPWERWIFQNAFRSWAGDYNGSLAFAVSYVAFWLGVVSILHARKIHLRI